MQVSDFLMLQSLMKEPFIPHPHAAIPGGVRAADVNAILLVLKKVSIGERSESMMSGEGPAFHNILFHLAGGEDAELRPPPRKDEDESARIFSANLGSTPSPTTARTGRRRGRVGSTMRRDSMTGSAYRTTSRGSRSTAKRATLRSGGGRQQQLWQQPQMAGTPPPTPPSSSAHSGAQTSRGSSRAAPTHAGVGCAPSASWARGTRTGLVTRRYTTAICWRV